MPSAQRFHWSLFIGLVALLPSSALEAGLCLPHTWTLKEIADAPVLVTGRVVSLDRENGPHFTGDPKQSAPPQRMTAEVEVLRFTQQAAGAAPARRLKVRFTGRDGPDFSFCPHELPELEPGQVLLLPLRGNLEGSSEPWQLIGAEGSGITTRVAEKMEEPAPAASDSRSFVIRELVNSFRRGDPFAVFTAASLVATQTDYLEPEFTAHLQRSIGSNNARWAQVLGNLLLSYPRRPLPDWPDFKGFPLAQLALSRLPGTAAAETLVWQTLVADLPGFADEPYHPLFSYNSSFALHAAERYLSRYGNDSRFIEAVKAALREDRPGSSALAAVLIEEGQTVCLPEALVRAMKVVRRPAADGDDVMAAIRLLLRDGTEDQRGQLAALAGEFKSTNPDYAAFLQLKLAQSP